MTGVNGVKCALAFALAVLSFVWIGAASGATRLSPCGSGHVLCGSVSVPLDYSGATPGRIDLNVEELPAAGTVRGAVFLVAGGPGQASAGAFDLSRSGSFWRELFPGYTLIAYDDRGTGKSGPLSCPVFDTATDDMDAAAVGRLITRCGESLGAAREFYGTYDHAEDMDVVRRALGVDRIALWGVSYGTKQVVAYALAHPDHVERIVLDSAVAPEGQDPLATNTLRAIPAGIASICHAGACSSVSRDPAGDLARLANRLEAKPATVTLPAPYRSFQLDGLGLLSLVIGSDLAPGLAAELPAAVSAANAGRMEPLERVLYLTGSWSSTGAISDVNTVLNLATVCDDGPFPWASDASIPVRQQQLAAAIAGLPPGATGPFGSWAVALGSASTCLNWPSPSGGRTLAPGPLPDVPTLVLSGGQDMRTPREGAVAEAARFPQGHLLVAPGVGHGVTGSSVCVDDALRAWVGGATPPAACPRVAPIVAPLGPFRRSLADEPPTRPGGRAGSTLAAVVATLQEARAAWLFTGDAGATLTGLEGGTLKPGKNDSFRLKGYSDVRGVELNGVVTFGYDGPTPSSLVGVIDVSGTGAHGSVSVRRSRLTGKLDGRAVSLRLRG